MPSVSGVKPLKVPERHVAALRALLRMEEDDFAHLLRVLETAKPTDSRNKLAESIHRELQSVRPMRAHCLMPLWPSQLSSSGPCHPVVTWRLVYLPHLSLWPVTTREENSRSASGNS